MIHLDRYFGRIGARGDGATLATLATLLDHHMTAIPFENLDVLLGRPPRLDLASLQAKLVDARQEAPCCARVLEVAPVPSALDQRHRRTTQTETVTGMYDASVEARHMFAEAVRAFERGRQMLHREELARLIEQRDRRADRREDEPT